MRTPQWHWALRTIPLCLPSSVWRDWARTWRKQEPGTKRPRVLAQRKQHGGWPFLLIVSFAPAQWWRRPRGSALLRSLASRPMRIPIGMNAPAGLHDAGDAGRIVAITLIDLHLEYSLGMARVDTDHRQAKLFELGPQPCGSRSGLKADPYRSRCFRSQERSDRLRLGID